MKANERAQADESALDDELLDGMSDSSDEDGFTPQQRTQQVTPGKRRSRVVNDDSDDDAAPSPSQVPRVDWEDKPLFKGESARSAVGRRVAVTYIVDGRREAFIGTVVNASPSRGLRVTFDSDDTEEWVNTDNGDEWEWLDSGDSSSSSAEAEAEKEYVVERILDQRTDRDGKTYLVKWEGYPDEANTWEPEEGVVHLDAFAAFMRRQGKRPAGQAKQPATAAPSDDEEEAAESAAESAEESADDDDGDYRASDGSGDEEDAEQGSDSDERASASSSRGTFRVGQHIKAMYLATEHGSARSRGYYPGKVAAAHDDGTFDIHYDDGDKEQRVQPKFIRARARPTASRGGAGGGGDDDDDDDDDDDGDGDESGAEAREEGGGGGARRPRGHNGGSHLRCAACGEKKHKDSFSAQMKRGDYGVGGILKCLHCSTRQRAGKNAAVREYEARAASHRREGGAADEETPTQARERERAESARGRAKQQRGGQRHSRGGPRAPQPPSSSESDDSDEEDSEEDDVAGAQQPRGREREATAAEEMERRFGRGGARSEDEEDEDEDEEEEEEENDYTTLGMFDAPAVVIDAFSLYRGRG